MRRGGTRHLIVADHVDPEDALELVAIEQVHASVRDRLGDGGVVDEHIEPAASSTAVLTSRTQSASLATSAWAAKAGTGGLAPGDDLIGAALARPLLTGAGPGRESANPKIILNRQSWKYSPAFGHVNDTALDELFGRKPGQLILRRIRSYLWTEIPNRRWLSASSIYQRHSRRLERRFRRH